MCNVCVFVGLCDYVPVIVMVCLCVDVFVLGLCVCLSLWLVSLWEGRVCCFREFGCVIVCVFVRVCVSVCFWMFVCECV